jgi:hypothetical protein
LITLGDECAGTNSCHCSKIIYGVYLVEAGAVFSKASRIWSVYIGLRTVLDKIWLRTDSSIILLLLSQLMFFLAVSQELHSYYSFPRSSWLFGDKCHQLAWNQLSVLLHRCCPNQVLFQIAKTWLPWFFLLVTVYQSLCCFLNPKEYYYVDRYDHNNVTPCCQDLWVSLEIAPSIAASAASHQLLSGLTCVWLVCLC